MGVRLNIAVSDEVYAMLHRVSAAQGVSMTDVIRRGIAVIKAIEREYAKGPVRFGFAKDPANLDLELIGLF